MHIVPRRGMALSILCLFAAGCAKPDARGTAKSDPNTPAVVELGMPKPPATANEPPRPVVDERQLVLSLAQNYSLLAAAMANGDARMIGTLYAADAELSMSGGTYSGGSNIEGNLAAMGRQQSLADFQRRTQRHHLTDSTVVDSGIYQITLKRHGGDSVSERGTYATRWRIQAGGKWVMEQDFLKRAGRKQKLL